MKCVDILLDSAERVRRFVGSKLGINIRFRFASPPSIYRVANYNFLSPSASMSAHFFICAHYRHLMRLAVKFQIPGDLNNGGPRAKDGARAVS